MGIQNIQEIINNRKSEIEPMTLYFLPWNQRDAGASLPLLEVVVLQRTTKKPSIKEDSIHSLTTVTQCDDQEMAFFFF